MAIPEKGLTLPEIRVGDILTPASLARILHEASRVLEREGRTACEGYALGVGGAMRAAARQLEGVALFIESCEDYTHIYYAWLRGAIDNIRTLANWITWKDDVLASYVDSLCDLAPERVSRDGVMRMTSLEAIVLRALVDAPDGMIDSTRTLLHAAIPYAIQLGTARPNAACVAEAYWSMHPSWVERTRKNRKHEWRILPRGRAIITGVIPSFVFDDETGLPIPRFATICSASRQPDPYADMSECQRFDKLLDAVGRELSLPASRSMTQLYEELRWPRAVSMEFLDRIVTLSYARCFADSQCFGPVRFRSLWRRMRWLSEDRLIELFDRMRTRQVFDDRRIADMVQHPGASPSFWQHVLSFPVSLATVEAIMRAAVYRDLEPFAVGVSRALSSLTIIAR